MALEAFSTKRGSIGGQTYQHGRFGTIVRARVFPINPQTSAQQSARGRLTAVAQTWRTITEAQRLTWLSLASDLGSRLSGFQIYAKVNSNRALNGEALATTPPTQAIPPVVTLLTATLSVTAVSAVITFTGTTPGFWLLRATSQALPGIYNLNTRFRYLQSTAGTSTPQTVAGFTAWSAKFGTPIVGRRIELEVVPVTSGWAGIPYKVSGLVA
jgi:hypothetical protein